MRTNNRFSILSVLITLSILFSSFTPGLSAPVDETITVWRMGGFLPLIVR